MIGALYPIFPIPPNGIQSEAHIKTRLPQKGDTVVCSALGASKYIYSAIIAQDRQARNRREEEEEEKEETRAKQNL